MFCQCPPLYTSIGAALVIDAATLDNPKDSFADKLAVEATEILAAAGISEGDKVKLEGMKKLVQTAEVSIFLL